MRALHLGGTNGNVQSDLSALSFNNGEQLEDFHGIIIIIKQEITLSGETVSPTRLLFQHTKEFLKRIKIKTFIAPNMTDLTTLLYNSRKLAVYTGGIIYVLYHYLEIIEAPTALTTSVQRSHHFGPSSSTNNDTSTLHPVIAALLTRQKIICE